MLAMSAISRKRPVLLAPIEYCFDSSSTATTEQTAVSLKSRDKVIRGGGNDHPEDLGKENQRTVTSCVRFQIVPLIKTFNLSALVQAHEWPGSHLRSILSAAASHRLRRILIPRHGSPTICKAIRN